eukprot:4632621-Prymnesium_polylepis.1
MVVDDPDHTTHQLCPMLVRRARAYETAGAGARWARSGYAQLVRSWHEAGVADPWWTRRTRWQRRRCWRARP